MRLALTRQAALRVQSENLAAAIPSCVNYIICSSLKRFFRISISLRWSLVQNEGAPRGKVNLIVVASEFSRARTVKAPLAIVIRRG